MKKIKVALVGVGNCASSLVQGRYFYDGKRSPEGLMHERIGGYRVADIEFVLAIDTDARKVGKDLSEAIFAAPNCTAVFHKDVPQTGVAVRMGRVLDGMAAHMEEAGERGFIRSDEAEASQADIVAALEASGAEVLVNYLPVGSEEATRFYMECALEAGVAVVNCMPVFIASDPTRNGRSASATRTFRSSATTSRRNWARPSSTASCRACFGRAAFR